MCEYVCPKLYLLKWNTLCTYTFLWGKVRWRLGIETMCYQSFYPLLTLCCGPHPSTAPVYTSSHINFAHILEGYDTSALKVYCQYIMHLLIFLINAWEKFIGVVTTMLPNRSMTQDIALRWRIEHTELSITW